MAESKKHESPKSGAGDKAHAVVRAGLGAIPYAGGAAVELFTSLIQPPLLKRQQKWMEEIAESIRQLETDKGINLDDLKNDDKFIDTLIQASQTAMKNSQEEKRAALRNAVINAALPNPPEESLQHMFLSLIDEFTVWHLRILKLFHDPSVWAEQNNDRYSSVGGGLSDLLEKAYPELKGKRDLYDQIWINLYARGLVNTDSLHSMMSEPGLMQKRTTEMGSQFLQFIETPD